MNRRASPRTDRHAVLRERWPLHHPAVDFAPNFTFAPSRVLADRYRMRDRSRVKNSASKRSKWLALCFWHSRQGRPPLPGEIRRRWRLCSGWLRTTASLSFSSHRVAVASLRSSPQNPLTSLWVTWAGSAQVIDAIRISRAASTLRQSRTHVPRAKTPRGSPQNP